MKTRTLVVTFFFLSTLVPVVCWGVADQVADSNAKGASASRTLNTALFVYAKTYSKGFPASLSPLGPPPAESKKPSENGADLVVKELAAGEFNGYVFTYTPKEKNSAGQFTKYTIVARPQKWQEGAWSYFTDQSAAIHWTDQNRVPNEKDPVLSNRGTKSQVKQ